jgi:hypothetical protein
MNIRAADGAEVTVDRFTLGGAVSYSNFEADLQKKQVPESPI